MVKSSFALKIFSGLNLQLLKLRLQLRWSNLHFICSPKIFFGLKINLQLLKLRLQLRWSNLHFICALKFFSGLNLQLLKLRLQLRWSNLHFICISAVHIIFILRKLICYMVVSQAANYTLKIQYATYNIAILNLI